MKSDGRLLAVLLLAAAGCCNVSPGRMQTPDDSLRPGAAGAQAEEEDLPGIGESPDVVPAFRPVAISDPLEPVNRAFFHFNDKLYFWVLKPVSRGYAKVVPQAARRGVRNFFSNIATPARLANCLLQAEFKDAWVELERFAINTTVGVAGFGDPARNRWNLERRNEDLGQTLGRYGLGSSLYICWPIIGPSSVRDTVGRAGDIFLDPITYLVPRFEYNVAVRSYDTVNGTSLRDGEYEDFKRAAIDPYVALRDAYFQYRRQLIHNGGAATVRPAGPMPAD